MPGSTVWRHFNTNKYVPIGIFSSATNFIADINKTKDFADNPTDYEGIVYYDTTLNKLRNWNGSTWTDAGMTGVSAGSMNDTASLGTKITIDGSTVASTVEIECSDNGLTSGALLLLDNNDTTNDPICLDIDNDANATTAVSIDIDGTAGYDIQGTSDTWHVTYQGVAQLAGLFFADDATARFGNTAAAPDMTLAWDATQFEFIPSTNDYVVAFGDGAPRIDVKIWGANTNAYVSFDASANEAIFEGYDIGLQDDDIVQFGNSNDVVMYWDQTQMQVIPAASGSDLFLGSATYLLDVFHYGDVAFDGVTAGRDVLWDRSENTLEVLDNTYVAIGTDDDITLMWDDTSFNFAAAAADTPWKIGGTSSGFDITYYFESSGTITTDYDGLIRIYDGCDIRLSDDDYLLLGDSASAGGTVDNTIRYDSSGDVLEIVGGVLFEDDVQIGESGATNTLTVYGDVTLSGSLSYGTAAAGGSGTALSLADNEKFYFGTGNDLYMAWDASNFLIEAGTQDTGTIRIGSTNSLDFIWYDNDATDTFTLDAGASSCTLLNLGLTFSDGTSTFTVAKPASNALNINAGTADETIIIGATTNTDVNFQGGTATKDMVWDSSDNSLEFADGAIIALGSSDDVEIMWDGSASTLNIEGAAANKSIVVGGTNTCDLTLNGGTAGRDIVWDASDNSLEFADNAILAFGSSDDVEITWDGSSSTLDFNGGAANNQIRFGDPTNVDLVICGGTTGNAITFDTDDTALSCTFNGFDLILQDDDILKFGDAPDVTITWTGSSSALYVDAAAADRAINVGYTNNMDLVIHAATTGSEITFDTDDTAKVCIFDGFDLRLNDDDILQFGDVPDVTMTWTGSSSALYIDAASADRAINIGYTNNMDLVIHGGTTGSEVTFDTDDSALLCIFDGFDLRLNDADILNFGDSNDITITWAGGTNTYLSIESQAADNVINVGKSTNMDIVIFGDTSTDSVEFDTSAEDVRFNGFDLTILDDDIINFGDADDITITWTGSSSALYVDGVAADRAINVGYTNNLDLVIHGGTTGSEVTFDTDDSALICIFDGFDLRMNDDDIFKFGDDSDFTFTFDSTNSVLVVEAGTADTVVSIGKSTNMDVVIYGDTSTDAVTFDTSAEDVQLNGFDLTLQDADILNFGDSDDITITWAGGTDTYLAIDSQSADNIINFGKTNNVDIVIYGDTSTDAITFDTSAEMCTFNGFDLTMNDGDIIQFGDSGADGSIYSDETDLVFSVTGQLWIGDGTSNTTTIESNGNIHQYGTAVMECTKYNIVACGTTEAYTVTAATSGSLYTTKGATDTITFTLPAVSTGLHYKFANVVDQTMTIASAEGDNMVIMNDSQADSVTYQTAGELIGGTMEVICDGTSWYVFMTNWADDAVSQTFTTAT